jgi:hypothetical protein
MYKSLNSSEYYLVTPIEDEEINWTSRVINGNSSSKLFNIEKRSHFYMIVSDITLPSEQSIINYESASGDGGITINNGRLCEEISLSGVILGRDGENLLSRCAYLTHLKELGTPVDFIHPFTRLRKDKGNKYYIKKIDFNLVKANNTAVPFTMTLVEYREANVKTTAVNLVNYQTADFMKQYYFNLVGNL